MRICLKCSQAFDAAHWCCPVCDWQPPIVDGFSALAPEFALDGGGFSSYFFAKLARLEAGSFWFRGRNKTIIWALQRYFPKIENFLEVGCGTGFVLSGIAAARDNLHLTGSEIFSRGLGFAAARVPAAELMQMDARCIPFVSEFDAIGIFDVLEHIVEDEAVLLEIAQALRPAGGFLLTVPQHPFLWSVADKTAKHVRRYSARDLKWKVERAGFKILRLTSFVSLLLPIMLASRWRKRGARADTQSELALSPAVDALLERVMSLELLLIRSGLNFPVGGSLLLIAVKA